MDYMTTVRLSEDQEQALKRAELEHDRSQSYLIRKAIEIVYVLRLVNISEVATARRDEAAVS